MLVLKVLNGVFLIIKVDSFFKKFLIWNSRFGWMLRRREKEIGINVVILGKRF